ncbi:hypothetical protein ACFL06_01720 [Patescibacteria group bacterium]
MKKILLTLVLASMLLPAAAGAVTQPTSCVLVEDLSDIDPACAVPAGGTTTVLISDYGACCAVNSIYKVVNIIFVILVGVAIILFLFGAFTLITAAGNPEKVTSGRNYILYAIVGLAVAMLARAVPAVAKMMMGGV